jgi:sulfite exporter TauE/SafE
MYARRATFGFGVMNLFWIAYLVVGAIVASDHNYFEHVNKLEQVLEAILALLLWALVLLGVDMRI